MKTNFKSVAVAFTMTIAALSGATGVAFGKTCELSIDGTDAMQFSTKELSADASCTEVKLTLKHVGKLPKAAMGHNWVLTLAADAQDVANKSMAAGASKDYIVDSDKRVIAHTKMIGGGETTSVSFKTAGLKAGADYKFFCTFPGHFAIMNGVFKFGAAKK